MGGDKYIAGGIYNLVDDGFVKVNFSFVVPVYNVGEYLEVCIDSLLDQSEVEFEIILIDDGSTDDSGAICDRYAEKHACIKVFHQNNSGAAVARNVGVKHASGEYILFVDGDDFIAKDALRDIEEEIIRDNYPDIVFLECKKVFFDNENQIIKDIPMQDGVTGTVRDLGRKDLLTYIAQLPKYPASPCTKAVKRDLLLQHGLMFQDGLLYEDLEWALRLFLAADSAGYCATSYYFYRQNRENSCSSVRSEKKTRDLLFIVKKWIDSMQEYQQPEEKQLIRSLMEYVFRFLILDLTSVRRERGREYKKRVRRCEGVLGVRHDLVSKLIRITYKVCGISVTNRMLRCYLNLRESKPSIRDLHSYWNLYKTPTKKN